MTKSEPYPKVSFLLPHKTLDRVKDLGARSGMTMSETVRLLVEAGLEVFDKVDELDAEARQPEPPPPAALAEPTRGYFPRPTGGRNGDPS